MKTWTRLALLFVALSMLGGSSPVLAIGFGAHLRLESGSGKWTFDDDVTPEFDQDADFSRFAVGFVLDTAPAEEKLFNYRLQISGVKLNSELDPPFQTEFDFSGLTFTNSFGFKLYRSEKVRLWLGPQVRAGFHVGELEGTLANDAVAFEFGVGGVFGANFHVSDQFTVGLEAGHRWIGYAGLIEWDDGSETDITGGESSAFGAVVFLFRL